MTDPWAKRPRISLADTDHEGSPVRLETPGESSSSCPTTQSVDSDEGSLQDAVKDQLAERRLRKMSDVGTEH